MTLVDTRISEACATGAAPLREIFALQVSRLRKMDDRFSGLEQLAAALGVSVVCAVLPPRLRGFYDDRERRIALDARLTWRELLSVLAHELGHAHHGHTASDDESERQADEWAAAFLIDPILWEMYTSVSEAPAFLEDVFCVEPHILTAYRSLNGGAR